MWTFTRPRPTILWWLSVLQSAHSLNMRVLFTPWVPWMNQPGENLLKSHFDPLAVNAQRWNCSRDSKVFCYCCWFSSWGTLPSVSHSGWVLWPLHQQWVRAHFSTSSSVLIIFYFGFFFLCTVWRIIAILMGLKGLSFGWCLSMISCA